MPRHVALMSALLLALHASLASGRLLRAQGSATAHAAPPPPLPLVLATLPAAFLPINAAPEDAEPAGTVEMKIISGQPAPALPYAFMVALITESSFFCGGTLLDATTVLTAAHCVVDTNLVDNPDALEVWRIDGSTAQVAKIFAHPGYSASTIPNDNKDLTFNGNLHDVAVLKLAAPVADPIAVALPNATTVLPVGQQLQISGWGTTESGRASSVLLDADVKYLAPNQCPPDYDDVLCAGGTGENTCSGDSGGPLLLRDPETGVATQFGVTSHGPDCLSGPALAYGYYTDVRKYLPAIESFRQGQQIAWDSSSDSSGGGGGPTFGSLGQGTAQLTDAAAGGEAPAPAPAPQNAGDVPSNWGFVEETEAADASVGWGQGALDQIMCQVFSNC